MSRILDAILGNVDRILNSRTFQEVEIYIFAAFVASFLASVFFISLLAVCNRSNGFTRLVGSIVLHIFDYVTNLIVIYIFWQTWHLEFLVVLIPVHVIISLSCVLVALRQTDWKKWPGIPCLNFLYVVLVLGMLQAIQITLAVKDYRHNQSYKTATAVPQEMEMPSTMPSRFHFKAMDGILEGSVFGFFGMYSLLTRQWLSGGLFGATQTGLIYASCTFSFLTVGLALTELDYRASATLKERLTTSSSAVLQHLLFRASEVCVRLLTVLVFLTATRSIPALWYLTLVLIVIDYLWGLGLLVIFGGLGRMHQAPLLLAIPLLLANLLQFVDTPGVSRVARRITRLLVPFRAMELVFVILTVPFAPKILHPQDESVKLSVFGYLYWCHPCWLFVWAVSELLYIALYIGYAARLKPHTDLHSVIADGDVEGLQEILRSDVVPDLDVMSYTGQTPLHLAAYCNQARCMQLLLDEQADYMMTTADGLKNTALHIAVIRNNTQAVHTLCRLRSHGAGSSFFNAKNSRGDTPLHIATGNKHLAIVKELLSVPDMDVNVKNNKNKTPAECAPSPTFGFDRHSEETKIMEVLQEAESGRRPESEYDSLEMSFRRHSEERDTVGEIPSPVPNKGETTKVLLQQANLEDEAAFFKKFDQRASLQSEAQGRLSVDSPSCVRISSFLMSSGRGSLSRHAMQQLTGADPECDQETGSNPVSVGLEDFVEIRKLGEGTFGKVLLVKQKATGEYFAMKLMDKAKFKAQNITSKAVGEQFILKTTRHPFVVKLHYAFQGNSFWVLVMEFCPNGDLHDVLIQDGTPALKFKEAARYGAEMLLGLEHLHSINVIFRDLKLENVIVDKDWHAKLTDFGLSKKMYTSVEARTMCGSYGYVAPEIVANKPYSYAVDLYSYGVTLLMLLSGGDTPRNKPKKRLPPMKHQLLRRRLAEATGEWAQPEVCALSLIRDVTADDPKKRTTATLLKQRDFFKKHLGAPVDSLLPMSCS